MLDMVWNELRQQWRGSRLIRLGAWGILVILLIYALLWLDDRLSVVQLEWQRQQMTQTDLASLKQQRYWPRLVKQLQSQKQGREKRMWNAATSGLAKASVREFLNHAIARSKADIRLRETQFAEPQKLTGDVWEMRGRLSATTKANKVPWNWIALLESHQPRFTIENLDIRVGSTSGSDILMQFRIQLVGLGKKP